ncbi:MAG: PRC-barrel domain-containing protein, partial [Actinobacteria bacterium]|nr:PRC-barrel domain-containing protein [Actinomycetota bacterium]
MTSSVDMQALQDAQGNPVSSNDGEQIGKVEEVFHDTDTDQPEWIGIRDPDRRRHDADAGQTE